MKQKIAIIDTSWMMHNGRQALSSLSVTRMLPSGVQQVVPTGHIYSVLEAIMSLSYSHDTVIMAIDSKSTYRSQR